MVQVKGDGSHRESFRVSAWDYGSVEVASGNAVYFHHCVSRVGSRKLCSVIYVKRVRSGYHRIAGSHVHRECSGDVVADGVDGNDFDRGSHGRRHPEFEDGGHVAHLHFPVGCDCYCDVGAAERAILDARDVEHQLLVRSHVLIGADRINDVNRASDSGREVEIFLPVCRGRHRYGVGIGSIGHQKLVAGRPDCLTLLGNICPGVFVIAAFERHGESPFFSDGSLRSI